MIPVILIIVIVIFIITLLGILIKAIKYCSDKCKPHDGPTRRNPQWSTYNDYDQNNTFTTGNDYITNNEIYETHGVQIPMDRDFNITHTVTHHTETPAAGGLANDIGSAFSDMFYSGGGFDSGGGLDSGGGDTGGGDTRGGDTGGGDTGGGDTGGGDTGGGDTGGGDTGGSSYD